MEETNTMSNNKKSGGFIDVSPLAKEIGAGTNWCVHASGNFWNRSEVEEDPWDKRPGDDQDSFLLPEEDRW